MIFSQLSEFSSADSSIPAVRGSAAKTPSIRASLPGMIVGLATTQEFAPDLKLAFEQPKSYSPYVTKILPGKV